MRWRLKNDTDYIGNDDADVVSEVGVKVACNSDNRLLHLPDPSTRCK
jgi:hypothetical protein